MPPTFKRIIERGEPKSAGFNTPLLSGFMNYLFFNFIAQIKIKNEKYSKAFGCRVNQNHLLKYAHL